MNPSMRTAAKLKRIERDFVASFRTGNDARAARSAEKLLQLTRRYAADLNALGITFLPLIMNFAMSAALGRETQARTFGNEAVALSKQILASPGRAFGLDDEPDEVDDREFFDGLASMGSTVEDLLAGPLDQRAIRAYMAELIEMIGLGRP